MKSRYVDPHEERVHVSVRSGRTAAGRNRRGRHRRVSDPRLRVAA
ncbi:hypothetical protein [Paraburkholderia caballeronis]